MYHIIPARYELNDMAVKFNLVEVILKFHEKSRAGS